ncbi:uncharacterized protein LAJ45_09336 [Morchella importuna]|uniref:uncharacterized protein n=1 Tax=Morchella importuna TaxID=1174673 RepID=UPI001E8D93B1|nr:uncharacterized protein LAJ45_09336 [Morchella importuna]KAH8146653.1 hypothetical protein LAJ45_09336 [Morchella importuna]
MAKTTIPSALKFELTARCSTTRARASILQLPHGTVQTPLFMPVATQGSLKGLTPEQLEATGCRLCLNNTYHLGLRPGQEVLDTIKGAHALQSWPHNILTDSGGFQMVSLLDLATVTERGVDIGSDIIMQLDDVIATTSADTERMREAMLRSVRWLDRCIEEHSKPDPMAAVEGQTYASRQNLFCIIQGGLDLEMRRECCEEMVKRGTPGIAIGGLSGGEEKESYCKVVKACTEMLPEGKPRYVMGVGYPEDLIVSVALGADMFDCVWGTRTARFGNAITSSGVLNLRSSTYATDFTPIDPHCQCPVCRPLDSPAPPLLNSSICPPSYASEGETYTAKGMGITKAYIHHLVAKETVGAHLLTMHNVAWLLALMARAREAVVEDRFPAFVKGFFEEWYQGDRGRYPGWAVEALRGVGVDLLE